MSVFRGAGGGGSVDLLAAVNSSAGKPIVDAPPLLVGQYAANSVISDFRPLAGALSAAGRLSLLQSISVSDAADQGTALSILLAKGNAALGAQNAAPTISDADSFNLLGKPLVIAAADWTDLGGNRVAGIDNIGRALFATAGTSIYYAVLNGTGTPTFGAINALQFTFVFLHG